MGNGWVGPNWDPPNQYAAEIDWEWMADDPTPWAPHIVATKEHTTSSIDQRTFTSHTKIPTSPVFQATNFWFCCFSIISAVCFNKKNTSDLTKTWSCPRNPGDSWWFPVSLWNFPSAKKQKSPVNQPSLTAKLHLHNATIWNGGGEKKNAADEKFPWKLIKKMPWKMLVKRLSSCWNNPCFFETTFVHFPVG